MATTVEGSRMPFHVAHKVPAGDGLYVRAKHAQLVERNPEKAISLFRAALEAGDRVDSALKDLAIVLKQLNCPENAIEAISAFRSRCSDSAQDSLDNVLLDLYKSCGRLEDQISLLTRKLRTFEHTQSFNGKRTKTARSQGKKFQVSVEQEVARLLGNLGWAYMQQSNYKDAESVYRRAVALDIDSNKVCNLGVCLMKQGKVAEAMAVLEVATVINKKGINSNSHVRSHGREQEFTCQASSSNSTKGSDSSFERSSLPGASSMEGVETHRHRNREGKSRIPETDPFSYEVQNLIDEQANAYKSEKRGSETKSDDISAAWKLASSNGQCDDGFAFRYEDEASWENIEEGGSLAMQTALRKSPVSSSLKMIQTHAQTQRRLPVFQAITLLGSAAA